MKGANHTYIQFWNQQECVFGQGEKWVQRHTTRVIKTFTKLYWVERRGFFLFSQLLVLILFNLFYTNLLLWSNFSLDFFCLFLPQISLNFWSNYRMRCKWVYEMKKIQKIYPRELIALEIWMAMNVTRETEFIKILMLLTYSFRLKRQEH